MSKIEEALRKAQENGGGKRRNAGALQIVRNNNSSNRARREVRIEHSKQIAKMAEDELLSSKALDKARIVHRNMDDTSVENSFRNIRTRLLQKDAGESSVVMVTSVCGGSGNSFVSLNMTSAFSFDKSRTALLIDCNLHNPAYENLLSYDDNQGITDYLDRDDIGIEEIIHSVGIDRLRLIPAGSQRDVPVEYFTSVKMQELLNNVRNRYPDRFVVVDAPPVLESADSQILVDLCDYVLLVVPYGKVTETKIMAAARAIGEKKLLGVIFNDEPKMPKLPDGWLFAYIWGKIREIPKRYMKKSA
jgi:capsular exopolysaccharide synthesis family protein